MKLVVCALSIGLLAAAALAAPVTPYDFTGHWSGTVQAGPQHGTVFADLSGTQTFTGVFAADVGGLLTCSVTGKQKKKVKITLTCSDTSKVKVKATLDATSHTLAGHFHQVKKGRVHARGTITMTSPGSCVPTAGDCTDPATGGGEAAVCCGGDCQRVVNPDNSESHLCN